MSDLVPGLVSVVMPFLNPGPYFEAAIESVRAQTYPDWELLLVDDGSTDGSGDFARRLVAAAPDRIRLLAHADGERHGASAARNLGIQAARGEFLAMLDADDVWLPDNLSEQVHRLHAAPDAGVLCSRTMYWHSWNGTGTPDYVPALGVPPDRVVPPPGFLILCIGGRASVPCTCSMLIRRRLIEWVGAFEARFPLLYDDQAFYAKLFVTSGVLPVDQCWAKYRRHSDSMTSTAERQGTVRESRQAFLTWLEDYVAKDPVVARAMAPTLRLELWRCRHPRADALLDRLIYLVRKLKRSLPVRRRQR